MRVRPPSPIAPSPRPTAACLAAALALMASLTAAPSRAETPPPAPGSPLTVSAAVAGALGFRPEVAAARAEQRRAASAASEARAALLPSVDGTANAAYHDKPIPVTPIHGFDPANIPDFETTLVQGGLRLGYTVWDGGRRDAAISGAGAEEEAAGAALDAAQQQVAARTVSTYLRVLTLGGTLEAADARIDAIDAEKARVEQLLDVGRAAQVDLRRAEASLAAARADRVRLATGLDAAERELARLVGVDPEATRYGRLTAVAPAGATDPDGPTGLPDRQALYRAAEENPALVEADHRLAAADASVELARGARRPTLAAVSDLQELGSTNGGWETEWSAGLQVSVPLFHGGALDERAAQAGARRDAVAERLRATRLDLHQRLDSALAALDRARARAAALGEARDQYVEVARIEKLRLDTGVGIQADYLDAEASLLDARAGLVEARYDEVAARVDIARLTGALDLPWIERHLSASNEGAAGADDPGSTGPASGATPDRLPEPDRSVTSRSSGRNRP